MAARKRPPARDKKRRTKPAKAKRTKKGSPGNKPSARKSSPRAVKKPSAATPFARVWAIVQRIPRGKVATYGQISDLIERRLTPIGVGWAIRAAPEDAIPWQRVVNASGGISTDDQHPGLQRAILEAEGVAFGASGRIDLAAFQWKPRGGA